MSQLQYKTYDSLMSSIEEDLWNYANNGLIKRKRYIKTARECNALLGIKIHGSKEAIIQVEDFKADLPTELMSIISVIGFIEKDSTTYFPGFSPNNIITGDCQFIQNIQRYSGLKQDCIVLSPTRKSGSFFCENSINIKQNPSTYHIDINENSITVDFQQGYIYLHYIPHMETEDGELLVLDHPLVNRFYEESIKEKIFRDLWHNNDADTQLKYQECRDVTVVREKQRASNIVKIPEYKKLREWNKQKELEFYNKYIKYL